MNFAEILSSRFVLRFTGVSMIVVTLMNVVFVSHPSLLHSVFAAEGDISTMAGNGTDAFSGDGGLATGASLQYPSDVALDSDGNIYIADLVNHRIRKVTVSTGIITTVAGDGNEGYSGDGVAATSTSLNYPRAVAVDNVGNIYIADSENHRIRKVTVSTGIITTVAGTGTSGYNENEDGGQATSAMLWTPYGVAVDENGNIYIADSVNNRIRKVTVSTGIITTVAGDGTIGSSGDGGQATSAAVGSPYHLALDTDGNIYIVQDSSNFIRKVTVSTGIITTVAGSGSFSYSGDGGLATSAGMNPDGVTVDEDGNIYIGDSTNHRVRKVDFLTGNISTIAGNGTGAYSGDGSAATSANLNSPAGLAVDSDGNIFIADLDNHRIRMVEGSSVLPPPPGPEESQDADITVDVNDFLSFSIANVAMGDEPAGNQPFGAGSEITGLTSSGSNAYAVSGELGTPVYTQLQTTTNSSDGYSVTVYADDIGGRTSVLLRSGGVGGTAADEISDSLNVLTASQSSNDTLNTSVDTGLGFRVTKTNTSPILYEADEETQWGDDDTTNSLWAAFPLGTDEAQVIYDTDTFSAAPTTAYVNWFVGISSAQQTGLYSGTVTFTATAEMGGGGGGGGGGEE